MAKSGRKTKLTPAVMETLCKHISCGFQFERAAELTGIGKSTFFKWKKKAETAKTGLFREFRQALKKADASAEYFHMANINRLSAPGAIKSQETTIEEESKDGKKTKIVNKVSAGSWQASAWILERRFPDRWGRDREENAEDNQPLPWSDDGAPPVDPLGEYTG